MYKDMPIKEKWELIDKDQHSLNYQKTFKLDFSFIQSENIRLAVKSYVWRNYVEGTLVPRRLYQDLLHFKYFNIFAENNNINSFIELNKTDISLFISFLKTTKTLQTSKPLSYVYQKDCLTVLKGIFHWGQLYIEDQFPKAEIFEGNEYPGINRKARIDFIPDDVIHQINLALVTEENPYLKYGIIILQATGMRLGDMLNLTKDCLKPHPISGWTLAWYDHKKRKYREPMPIPNECAMAVQDLIEHTKLLREELEDKEKEYIFIHKITRGRKNIIGKVIRVSQTAYRVWLNGNKENGMLGFMERHGIKDADGKIYRIKAHQFRRTLATDMFSKGLDILIIRDVLGHSVARTTRTHYADIKDTERAELFKGIGIIGNIDTVDKEIVLDEEELQWFNENKYKGAKMCDGYCTMPFKQGELCERLLKRQKCYMCSRYITTLEYLDVHKNHLEEIQQQLNNNIYGEHYAAHLTKTVEILKIVIYKLEELQNDNSSVTA